VTDPETHVPVGERARAKLLTEAIRPEATEEVKAEAKMAASPTSDIPVGALGSGSDFSPFLDHLGVTTLSIEFGGEAKDGGVYHSRYDTVEHHTKFIDPGLVYGKVLAETIGHAVLYAADTGLPLQSPGDFANVVTQYVSKVKKLADTQRETAVQQGMLLANHAFDIAADPTEPHGSPVALKSVPKFDFSPLDRATTRLAKSAKAYNAAFATGSNKLSPTQLAKLQTIMNSIASTLLSDVGLPGRPWYKNLIYAPGRYIGYGVTTLPGVTEAITQERWSDVPTYISLTASALNAYSAKLDAATEILGSA
jgi:N-acetylated-alpha-linked acidic dipeptidase